MSEDRGFTSGVGNRKAAAIRDGWPIRSVERRQGRLPDQIVAGWVGLYGGGSRRQSERCLFGRTGGVGGPGGRFGGALRDALFSHRSPRRVVPIKHASPPLLPTSRTHHLVGHRVDIVPRRTQPHDFFVPARSNDWMRFFIGNPRRDRRRIRPTLGHKHRSPFLPHGMIREYSRDIPRVPAIAAEIFRRR
jgi:hypothetical protein